MKDSEKKELLKLIDQIAAQQSKLNELQDERRKANDEWNTKETAMYNELYKLQEKKRVLERDAVDNMVLG